MAVDAWYLASSLRSAREDLIASHLRLREVLSRGDADPEVADVAEQAMRADSAYYVLIAGHMRDLGSAEEDPAWLAIDAATSEIEGFTAGDPS
jgi:hypothetical protein